MPSCGTGCAATSSSGDWPPGTHRTLGASPRATASRSARCGKRCCRLAGEGLVQMRQHRGAVVPVLDAKLFANLYDLRGALQALLARRAAERATAGADRRHGAARGRPMPRPPSAATPRPRWTPTRHSTTRSRKPPTIRRPPRSTSRRSAFVNAVRLRLGFGPGRMAEAARAAPRRSSPPSGAAMRRRPPPRPSHHSMAAKRDLLARL